MSCMCLGIQGGLGENNKHQNMKIMQLNINHCLAAHDLLMGTLREIKIDTASYQNLTYNQLLEKGYQKHTVLSKLLYGHVANFVSRATLTIVTIDL